MSAEQPCPAVFVTGTDTGVGKTTVAATLARLFTRRGLKVGVMKPCETGVADCDCPGEDARLLCWAAESNDDMDLVAPYRFKEPLAPSLAAERTGSIIDITRIKSAFTSLRNGKDLMIVEGAGGLMVPLRGGYLVADLARDLNSPLLVVCRPSLGTVNHTLLTIFAARAMELPLAGFVLNRMPEVPDIAEQQAPHMLASLASADLLGVLPDIDAHPEEKVERLATILDGEPTLPWMIRAFGLAVR